MTLVAVWKSHGRLMAIADTRLVREPGNVLTEHGPKLLPLSVICRQPGVSGSFDSIIFGANIGFAYSGATLSALSSHALANVMFSNLISAPGTAPPSLAELSQAFAAVSFEYIREVGELAGPRGQFTAIVFGLCPQTKQFRGFEIKPRIQNNQLLIDVTEHDLSQDDSIIIIGSCPELLRQRIQSDQQAAHARGDVHPILGLDRPTRALMSIISDGADQNVGGAIQQGWVGPSGFEIVAKMMPVTPRPPTTRNAGLFVLGFDIMDMQNIGAHQVGLGGR
jgi:hypothetical protein